MTRLLITAVALLAIAFTPFSFREASIHVGSKKFTESVVLGEAARLLAEEGGGSVDHFRELGGTQVLFQGLRNGELDLYPEYTGTIAEEILGGENDDSIEAMRRALAKQGVVMSRPLGFSNSYVLGMLKPRAEELGIHKISDLARHPQLKLGFGNEFLSREDGWKNLKPHYDLPQDDVKGLDHDLAYRQLEHGAIDLIDAYATDAKAEIYDLKLLEDDLGFFPSYEAVLLYRADLADRFPQVVEAIRQIEGALSAEEMRDLNRWVVVHGATESRVAAEFLADRFGVDSEVVEPTRWQRIATTTLEHLDLVRKSLIPAILIAVPLGIAAARYPRLGHAILGSVSVVQTIPSLALLVILMPAMAYLGLASLGLGSATAVTALLLYSLLPIVRNTHAGLVGIAGEHREAAAALGLPPLFRLLQIELPLASRSILAGIKTAAVINVGFATLGALIGAGGYGQPILTGIRLNDTGLILEGALPAALMALVVQTAFDWSERFLTPKGLRI